MRKNQMICEIIYFLFIAFCAHVTAVTRAINDMTAGH